MCTSVNLKRSKKITNVCYFKSGGFLIIYQSINVLV